MRTSSQSDVEFVAALKPPLWRDPAECSTSTEQHPPLGLCPLLEHGFQDNEAITCEVVACIALSRCETNTEPGSAFSYHLLQKLFLNIVCGSLDLMMQ